MNRDVVIIGILCVAAVVGGAWLFTNHKDSISGEPRTISATVLIAGTQSGNFTERKNYRITSAEEFGQLWEMLYGPDMPPLPRVDFKKNEVLAVFDGTHSSGGYDVHVTGVTDSALARVVLVTHTEPGEHCSVTKGFTSPFEIVMLPVSALSISREDRVETTTCP